MSTIFGVNIGATIRQAFDGKLLPTHIKRTIPGEYDPVTDERGEPTVLEYITDGVVESYSDEMIAAGLATEKDRKILIIAQPISGFPPKIGDKIIIEDETYTVTGIPARDPGGATYTVKGSL